MSHHFNIFASSLFFFQIPWGIYPIWVERLHCRCRWCPSRDRPRSSPWACRVQWRCRCDPHLLSSEPQLLTHLRLNWINEKTYWTDDWSFSWRLLNDIFTFIFLGKAWVGMPVKLSYIWISIEQKLGTSQLN